MKLTKETAAKLTKLEAFVKANPSMRFEDMAWQLNLTYDSVSNACDRLHNKEAFIQGYDNGRNGWELPISANRYFTAGHAAGRFDRDNAESAPVEVKPDLSGARTVRHDYVKGGQVFQIAKQWQGQELRAQVRAVGKLRLERITLETVEAIELVLMAAGYDKREA